MIIFLIIIFMLITNIESKLRGMVKHELVEKKICFEGNVTNNVTFNGYLQLDLSNMINIDTDKYKITKNKNNKIKIIQSNNRIIQTKKNVDIELKIDRKNRGLNIVSYNNIINPKDIFTIKKIIFNLHSNLDYINNGNIIYNMLNNLNNYGFISFEIKLNREYYQMTNYELKIGKIGICN